MTAPKDWGGGVLAVLQIPSRRTLEFVTGFLRLLFSLLLSIIFLRQYIFISKDVGADLEGVARGLLYLALLPGWSLSLIFAPLAASSQQLLTATILSICVYLLLASVVYAVCREYNLSPKRLLSSPRLGVFVQVGTLILIVFPLLFAQTPFVWPDSSVYMARALNISKGLGYTDFGVPVTGRGPVYPFLISIAFRLFGATVESGLLVPKLVGVLNFLLIYWMGRSLFGGWAGFIGAVLAISCDTLRSYFFTSHLLDGTLALFMNSSLLILFVALERSKYWLFALAGISLCAAVLTKDTGILWLPVPWIVLLLSKKYRTARNFVGVWLSTAAFLITFYPWVAYVYSVDQHIFLLKPKGDHTNIWLALNVGIGLYLLVGIVAISCQKRIIRLFSRYASHFGRKARILFPIGGVALLLAAMSGSTYIYSGWGIFSPSFYSAPIIDYLQNIIRPVFGSLFIFVIFAWCLTLVLAFRREEHRLLAIPFSLVIPLSIHLSHYGWEARNYFMIVLLSYLLLGHYLDRVARWMIQTAEEFVRWKKIGEVARSAMLVGLCVLVSRPPTLVMEQFTENRLISEERRYTPSSQNVDNRIVHACVEWINNHVEPGTPVLDFDAWPAQISLLLEARYPITLLRSNQMNGKQFLDYLAARPKENVFYVGRDPDPTHLALSILTERELYQVIDREKIAYSVVGGRHVSLFGILDFFQMHPAFEEVFRIEEGAFGTAVFRIQLESLTGCPACPTVVEDLALLELLKLVKSEDMDEYEFLKRLGTNISVSTQPGLLEHTKRIARGEANISDFTLFPDEVGFNLKPGSENPLLFSAYVKLGQIYREHDDIERALIAYQQAVVLDPALKAKYVPDIQAWRASLLEYYTSGEGTPLEIPPIVRSKLPALAWDIYQARGEQAQALALVTDDPETLKALANAYLLWGEQYFDPELLSQVIAAYEQVIELDPDNELAYEKLAEVYQALDQMDEAIALYEKAIAANPDQAWPHWPLAEIYEAQDKPEQATAQYRQIIELEPDNVNAHVRLGELYQINGQLDQAIALLGVFSRDHPDQVWPYLELGQLYQEAKQTTEAIAACEKAIELESSARTYACLSNIYQDPLYQAEDRVQATIALYRAAARRNPDAAWPHIELGKIYLEQAALD